MALQDLALQDRLNAFKADFESGRWIFKPSQAAIDIMHRATDDLIASAQAQRARKAGEVAPEFPRDDIEKLKHDISRPEQFAVNFDYLARRVARK